MEKKAIERIISAERLEPYLRHHSGNFEKAVAHYKTNIEISESFYPLLSILEIGLRNNIDFQLNKTNSTIGEILTNCKIIMTEIPDHPAYSKNILEMLTVANDFCMTMARVQEKPKSELIDYLIKISPLLYIKGSLLDKIEVNNPDANQRYVTEEQWEVLFTNLRKKFGNADEFWFIDNSENHNEPVKGSLAEHYADIYQDMKDFLTLYQVNTLDAKENAVFEIKRSFLSHWGFRLVNAHKTLHHLSLKASVEPPNLEIPELF